MVKLKRFMNIVDMKYMQKEYSALVNSKNIREINRLKLRKIFKKEDKKIVDNYLHFVVDEYINDNYEKTIEFYKKCMRIVRKTKISLSELEKQELQLFEERVFSATRHIKNLSTKYPLLNGENAKIKFLPAKIMTKREGLWKIKLEGELLITNKRVIMFNENDSIIMNWENISKEKYSGIGFEFNYQRKTFLIRIHDQETLNNTILNFRKKINI